MFFLKCLGVAWHLFQKDVRRTGDTIDVWRYVCMCVHVFVHSGYTLVSMCSLKSGVSHGLTDSH